MIEFIPGTRVRNVGLTPYEVRLALDMRERLFDKVAEPLLFFASK
jgi:hypothetical protein